MRAFLISWTHSDTRLLLRSGNHIRATLRLTTLRLFEVFWSVLFGSAFEHPGAPKEPKLYKIGYEYRQHNFGPQHNHVHFGPASGSYLKNSLCFLFDETGVAFGFVGYVWHPNCSWDGTQLAVLLRHLYRVHIQFSQRSQIYPSEVFQGPWEAAFLPLGHHFDQVINCILLCPLPEDRNWNNSELCTIPKGDWRSPLNLSLLGKALCLSTMRKRSPIMRRELVHNMAQPYVNLALANVTERS